MGVNIIGSRWKKQPQRPKDIAWNNPICKGLCVAVVGSNPVNSCDNRNASINQAKKLGNKIGSVFQCATGQQNVEWANYQPILTNNGAGTGDFTMMVYANPAAGGGATQSLFAQKNDAAGAPYAQTGIYANAVSGGSYGSGSLEFLIYNGGPTYADLPGVIDGNWHLFAAVRKGITLTLYSDATSTSSSLSALSISQAGRYLAIGSQGNTTVSASSAQIGYAYAWNRALSAAEIAGISANPWQIFAP